jgi:hypothetical protein
MVNPAFVSLSSYHVANGQTCWNIKAILENKLPSPIVRLFFDSWKDYKKSILKIKKFHEENSSVKIVPTHCAITTDKLVSNTFFSNDL